MNRNIYSKVKLCLGHDLENGSLILPVFYCSSALFNRYYDRRSIYENIAVL